jgi:hypothetical protein
MKVTGQCHCGAIAYEAEVDPTALGICHCTDCQRLTGSAYRVTAAAPAATFRLKRGAPRFYIKTGDSGAKRRHAFCGDCGGPIYAAADSDAPPSYSLRVGALDQRQALAPPRRQIWCGSALPWSGDLSAIPKPDAQALS